MSHAAYTYFDPLPVRKFNQMLTLVKDLWTLQGFWKGLINLSPDSQQSGNTKLANSEFYPFLLGIVV